MPSHCRVNNDGRKADMKVDEREANTVNYCNCRRDHHARTSVLQHNLLNEVLTFASFSLPLFINAGHKNQMKSFMVMVIIGLQIAVIFSMILNKNM